MISGIMNMRIPGGERICAALVRYGTALEIPGCGHCCYIPMMQ